MITVVFKIGCVLLALAELSCTTSAAEGQAKEISLHTIDEETVTLALGSRSPQLGRGNPKAIMNHKDFLKITTILDSVHADEQGQSTSMVDEELKIDVLNLLQLEDQEFWTRSLSMSSSFFHLGDESYASCGGYCNDFYDDTDCDTASCPYCRSATCTSSSDYSHRS